MNELIIFNSTLALRKSSNEQNKTSKKIKMCDQIVGYYSVISSCSLLSNLLYYGVRLKLIRTPKHETQRLI